MIVVRAEKRDLQKILDLLLRLVRLKFSDLWRGQWKYK